jgi:hypothetical protein
MKQLLLLNSNILIFTLNRGFHELEYLNPISHIEMWGFVVSEFLKRKEGK